MFITYSHLSNLTPKFFFFFLFIGDRNAYSCLCRYEFAQINKRVFKCIKMKHHVGSFNLSFCESP